MAIVASNSLTVSNVNDGTITHTAWSYSADGTNGFTTAYPNLNLLSLSSVKIGKYLNWSNGLDLFGNANRAVFDYIQVVPNQTYTLSSSWNGWYISVFGYSDKTSSAKYILTGGKMQPITGSGFSESQNVTFTVPADCNYLRVHIGHDSINTSASVVKSVKAKVELGSTATPWMASQQEVTTADYPSYIGQYTNFTQADSTTPSDYTWSLIRGNDGADGKDAWTVVMSNENVTLPANAQGGVTSYANSNTTIGVTYGSGVDLTPVASGATLANSQFKVSASASNITAGTQTVDTINKKINYAVASGMSVTSGAVASITYTISIRNSAGVTSTVTKIQNFTKAEKGITGDKGIDSYTYIRYSASSNGANMTSLPNADSQYIGTCTTTQATAPTTAGSYVWAKFVGANGAKGDPTGITRSTTEPATRYTGMLWQYTGTVNLVATGITALPSSLYVWTGSAWQLYLVKSTNLQVDNGFITNAMIGDAQIESAKIKSLEAAKINAQTLAAITSILGDVTAGTYTSWNFSNTGVYKYLNGVYLYNGHLRSISIENSTVTDPDKNLTSKSYLIRGSDVYGGMVTFFNNTITTSAKPNDLLKGSSFFSGSNQASVLDSSRDSSGASALDIRSDNVRISGYASQTIPWTKLTDFAYYKVMFGRVNVRVGLTSGSSRDNIYLGVVPDQYKSPNGDMMLPAQAWSINTNLDRHVQYSTNGSLYLLNPEPNTRYVFEASYTL